jgi:hypothetical protein
MYLLWSSVIFCCVTSPVGKMSVSKQEMTAMGRRGISDARIYAIKLDA